jgi:muconolactone delta-isomerase
MVYLIDVQIDYNVIIDRLKELLPQEWEQTTKMFESGQLLGIWRKANAKGAVAIWNMPDHESVNAQIRAMPLYPYMSKIEIIPLVAHPKYPIFCEPRKDHGTHS